MARPEDRATLTLDARRLWPDPLLDGIVFERIGTTNTPGVPEPTTWAMMLTGFGLLGGALRRRRSGAVLARA